MFTYAISRQRALTPHYLAPVSHTKTPVKALSRGMCTVVPTQPNSNTLSSHDVVPQDPKLNTIDIKAQDLFTALAGREITPSKQEAKDAQVASNGITPAALNQIFKKWEGHLNCFALAAELRPYIGKGNKLVDYYFGYALMASTEKNHWAHNEGLYWISSANQANVPAENQSFKEFADDFIDNYVGLSYYSQDENFLFIDGHILAPSHEEWNAYKSRKFEDLTIAPEEYYQLDFNTDQLGALISAHNLNFSFFPPENDKISIHSLLIHKGSIFAGEIAFNTKTCKVICTFDDEVITPVVEYIEVLTKKSSLISAYRAIQCIKKNHENVHPLL